MLNNSFERPEAQDKGSIILTGFEPEIVLSSVRTVIEEHKQLKTLNLSAGQAGLELRTPNDYTITNTSWRVLKLILGSAGLSNKPVRRRRMVGNRIEHRCMLHTLIMQICTDKNSENPPAGRAGLFDQHHQRSIKKQNTDLIH